jgi:hypothetical protein
LQLGIEGFSVDESTAEKVKEAEEKEEEAA